MLLLALQVNAQSSVTGNCYTQRIDMDPLRMYALPFSGVAPALDVSRYDVTVDYGSVNVKATNPYGTDITLAKASNSKFGDGARISTTRYILYGRLTARIKTSTVPGLVTTFITMSDRKDEIDWEIVGGDSTTAQSNIFYKVPFSYIGNCRVWITWRQAQRWRFY
jgi:beta-glucanase (GH16 family)